MNRLTLVRHAQTEAPPGQCYGATDVAVPAGASAALAQQMAPWVSAGTVLRCSPLRRCAELAQAIHALRPDLAVQVDSRLAEMDFGTWEGRDWSAIPRAEFDGWIADFAEGRAGGTGESTDGLMQRVAAAFDEWRRSGCEGLWITHAGVMRAAQLLQRGVRRVERADQWPAVPIAYGESIVLQSLD